MPEVIASVGGLGSHQLQLLRELNSSRFTTFLHGTGWGSQVTLNFIDDIDYVLELKSSEREVFSKFRTVHFRFVYPHDPKSSSLVLLATWAGIFPRLEALHVFGLITRPNTIFSLVQALSRRCPSLHTLVIETQEYDIKTILTQHCVIFPPAAIVPSRTVPQTTFSDIVDDIVLMIMSLLGPGELYTLLMVNQRLRDHAFPFFLEAHQSKWLPSQKSLHVKLSGSYGIIDSLSGLAISPMVTTTLGHLRCTIPGVAGNHLLIWQLLRLHRFIERLDTCKELDLIFEEPYYRPAEARTCEIWTSCFINFIKRVVERGCTKLCIRGGGYFIQTFSGHSSTANSKQTFSSRISRIFRPEVFIPADPPSPPAFLFLQFSNPNALFRSTSQVTNQLSTFGLESPMLGRPAIIPHLYDFIHNSPHLTHLRYHLHQHSNDELRHFAGAFKHLIHFVASGVNVKLASLNLFLSSVPTLTYLRVGPLYVPSFDPPPRPAYLPNLQILLANPRFILFMMSDRNALPNIKSIGIISSNLSVPFLPPPDHLLKVSKRTNLHPNSPELFVDLTFTGGAKWTPSQHDDYSQSSEWVEGSASIKKIVFKNVEVLLTSAPDREIDYGILLQLIKLFPNISYAKFVEDWDGRPTEDFDQLSKSLSDRLAKSFPSLICEYEISTAS